MITPLYNGIVSSSFRKAVPTPDVWSNNYSVLFDGVDESAYKTNPSTKNDTKSGGKSISFWLKHTSTPTSVNARYFNLRDYVYPSNNPFWTIGYVGASNRLVVQCRRYNGSTFYTPQEQWNGITLSINTWYHLVVTTDGTDLKLYLNGSLRTKSTAGMNGFWWGDPASEHPTLTLTSTATLEFGRFSTLLFAGNIDEATYWNTELDSTEVTELYNSGTPADPSTHSESANLISYWQMGDGDTYPTLQDSVGSDDLTMTNMESGDIELDVP